MRFGQLVAAELRKAATLPAGMAGIAVAVLGSTVITVLNALALGAGRPESPTEIALNAAPLGTVGAIVLGVVVIGSEYTSNRADAGGGRQIGATLSAIPHRFGLLAAKACVIVLLVAATAAVTIPSCIWIARVLIDSAETVAFGEALTRSIGTALYWTLMGLMAFAFTVLTRNGILPLIVLITNGSLVSFSLLLNRVTPLARYLPDAAGLQLFARNTAFEDALGPVAGGLVMSGWAVALLAIAFLVFTWRDA